jgi:hypothetical protein
MPDVYHSLMLFEAFYVKCGFEKKENEMVGACLFIAILKSHPTLKAKYAPVKPAQSPRL